MSDIVAIRRCMVGGRTFEPGQVVEPHDTAEQLVRLGFAEVRKPPAKPPAKTPPITDPSDQDGDDLEE